MKQKFPSNLLWINIEATGLNAKEDIIIEVAAEVTDFRLTTVASYEEVVKQPKETVLKRMQKNIWWKEHPENRDEFIQKIESGKDAQKVENELITLVDEHFDGELAILAGNSIHYDRKFIEQWWPNFDLKLHYRMLDVSSFKVFMQGRYGIEFEKKETHRAFDDIQASIAELEYYLDKLRRTETE